MNEDELLEQLLSAAHLVVYHIDLSVTPDGSTSIAVRQNRMIHDALTDDGRKMLDRIVDAMIEAGKRVAEDDPNTITVEVPVDRRNGDVEWPEEIQ